MADLGDLVSLSDIVCAIFQRDEAVVENSSLARAFCASMSPFRRSKHAMGTLARSKAWRVSVCCDSALVCSAVSSWSLLEATLRCKVVRAHARMGVRVSQLRTDVPLAHCAILPLAPM